MRKTTSRLAMLGVSVIATTALVGGTAGATSADTYAAKANADALVISVAGTQIAGSRAVADLNNDPAASALASSLLLPGVIDSGEITANATAAAPTDIKDPETCLGNEAEAIPGIARLDITCGTVSANIVDGLPQARALGAELVLEPSVSAVLSTLGLQDPVTDTVNSVVFETVLNPLVEALTGNPIGDIADDTVTTVQDVLNDTLTLNSTARVVVAPALSEVTSSADVVTATAHAQGLRIELLPVNELGATNGLLPDDLLPGEPLVTITIGQAKAVDTYNRVTGARGEPFAEAAVVTIEFGSTALTDALGLSAEPITVAPGVEQCILVGTPLESCVTVAAAGTDANGFPYATSTSVSLFKGIQGGVHVALGGVTAAATGAIPAAAPAPDLPRTGANPSVALMGGALLAAAVLVRRFLVGRA